jgi:hypothetical protein
MDEKTEGQARIDTANGPVFFIQTTGAAPDIPQGDGRECPQCKLTAWRKSRWCWHCHFDFDRAALPRIHPSKVAALSLLFNALQCVILGFLLYTAHMS